MTHRTSRRRTTATIGGAVITAMLAFGAVGTPTAPAAAAAPADTTHNAVSDSFSDTFADPSVIQAKDGWWYSFATADPLRAGDPPGIIHIARTKNWSQWEYLGTVFNDTNRPTWAEPSAGLWAPDIRYIDGKYLLYYTVTDTTLNPGGDSAIGVATAETPTGPWTPAPAPIIAPRKNVTDYFWTIDPAGFTDVDGQRYLYWGSFYGGGYVTKVSADGTTRVGEPRQVTVDNRYEGPFVVRHDGWYYLMASTANCCAGPATGYSVYTGRSRSPMGPFVDADGTSLLTSRVGGTPVVHQNGNRFIGVGHHAVATDNTGRDFLVYHGIDRNVPWLSEPFGINRRPMLIDRIDWIDGWPKVRAGAGPSDTDQPAPVLSSLLRITPSDPAAGGIRGLHRGPIDQQGGAVGELRGSARTSALPSGDVRIRLDIKTDKAFRLSVGTASPVTVTVDPGRARLSVDGQGDAASTALAPRSGWLTLTVQLVDDLATVQVSESDLGDPLAEVSVELSRRPRGPLELRSVSALIDNASVNHLAVQAMRTVPVPRPGKVLWANDFGTDVAGLSWVRQDPAATVSGGALNWPVQDGDLVGTSNTAGLLLADSPGNGDWLAETKLTLDLGVDQVRNYQQAGMIVYSDDDDFARLGTIASWNTRQTEWGRELAGAPDGRLIFGGAMVGTAAATLWMRIAHHRNAAGEQQYRAATSRDGVRWTWGAVWTFPAGSTQRVGLYTHGGAMPATVASFDYLRFSTTSWPNDPGRG